MSDIIPSLDTAASVHEFKLKGKHDSCRIFCFSLPSPPRHFEDKGGKVCSGLAVSSSITFLFRAADGDDVALLM